MSKKKHDNTQDVEPEVIDEHGPTTDGSSAACADAGSKDAEIASLKDQLLRTMAEYDNFRKRTQKEKEDLFPFAVATTVGRFLTVGDSLEAALSQLPENDEARKGIALVYEQFQKALSDLQIEEYGDRGDAFDPTLHNAVMQSQDGDVDSGHLAQVLQRGYKLGDKVIRFASVAVRE